MQRLFEHITSFSAFMTTKGFDGNFHSPFGFYDKLFENLIKHALQCLEEQKKLEVINLATYTHWRDSNSPYVRCHFETTYSTNTGFKVDKVNIEYGNQFGALKHKDVLIWENHEIPTRLEVNAMMLEQRMAKRI